MLRGRWSHLEQRGGGLEVLSGPCSICNKALHLEQRGRQKVLRGPGSQWCTYITKMSGLGVVGHSAAKAMEQRGIFGHILLNQMGAFTQIHAYFIICICI